MNKILAFTLGVAFAMATSATAFQQTDAVALTVKNIQIPISVMVPEKGKGPFPVVFHVHGGGWNGGTPTEVPGADFPPDASVLCDRLGIVYVALAYRCKAEGTFWDAMEDLHASISWFNARAATFNADTNRVGFSGGSAGTPLSALLAEEMNSCKAYVGLFGVYDFISNSESLFPDEEACKTYGIATPETKQKASAYFNLRPHPPATLLCAGAKDILICPKQSVRFGERLKTTGADAEVTIYPDVNHGYYSPENPVEFKDTTLKIARLYSKYLTQATFDFASLENFLDKMLEHYFPLAEVPPKAVVSVWKGKTETLQFLDDGTGKQINRNNKSKPFTYTVAGGSIKVTAGGVVTEYFMQKDKHAIYYIHNDHRYAGRKEVYTRERQQN